MGQRGEIRQDNIRRYSCKVCGLLTCCSGHTEVLLVICNVGTGILVFGTFEDF